MERVAVDADEAGGAQLVAARPLEGVGEQAALHEREHLAVDAARAGPHERVRQLRDEIRELARGGAGDIESIECSRSGHHSLAQ